MSGPMRVPPAVQTAVAGAFLIFVVAWIAFVDTGVIKLPTTIFSPRLDEILGGAAFTAFFSGLLLNGFWTGDILSIFWSLRSEGRSWASRRGYPWMFWFLAVFYACFALLGWYLLVREVLAL